MRSFLVFGLILVAGSAHAQESRWQAAQSPAAPASPAASDEKVSNQGAVSPARVRIGIRTTTFKRLVRSGQKRPSVEVDKVSTRTLRARVDKPNHFYIDDFHFETVPLKWIRQTKRLTLKIRVSRRFGAFGQLEDTVGDLQLTGTLLSQSGQDNTFVLMGATSKRFRDKFGTPIVDVVAGFKPRTPAAANTVAEGNAARPRIAQPPKPRVSRQAKPRNSRRPRQF